MQRYLMLLQEILETRFDELVYRAYDLVSRPVKPLVEEIRSSSVLDDDRVLSLFGAPVPGKHDLCRHIRGRSFPRFFFDQHDMDNYRAILSTRFGGSRERLLSAAERILAHDFYLLGKRVTFGESIDWHLSYDTGRKWPLVPWYEINVRDPSRPGDVKYVWEINRHQHLLILGRAYWATGDERYAQEFAQEIRSWLKENPLGFGVNWAYNLEISIRAITWIWCINFFLASPYLDDDLLFDMVRCLIYSARRLLSGMSYSEHCMPNNHLIGDAAGLAFIGIFLPELRESVKWRSRGFSILFREIRSQVYPDGVSFEQAVSYHRFVLYFYILVTRYLSLNQEGGLDLPSVPENVRDRIEKMMEFILWIQKPSGRVPIIGDWDNGRAIVLSDEPVNDFRASLSTGAVLFRRSDFKAASGELSEETFWLLGPESIEIYDNLSVEVPPLKTRSFPTGGYFIARSGWGDRDDYILFKNGPHANHGHADQLHIEVSSAGVDLLVDTGAYTYNGCVAWRNYFRSTEAHNTVVVDGDSQSIPWRVFRWLKRSRPLNPRTEFGINAAWMSGGHTGYRRLRDPVTHRRDLLYVPHKYIVILDRFDAKSQHDYEAHFHFSPSMDVLTLGRNGCTISTRQGGRFSLLFPDQEVTASVVNGQDGDRLGGWVSPGYGIKVPAPELILRKKASGSTTIMSLICLAGEYSEDSVRDLRCSLDGDILGQNQSATAWVVQSGSGEQDLIVFGSDEQCGGLTLAETHVGRVSFHGDVLLVRTAGLDLVYLFATNVTRLICCGLEFEARRPISQIEMKVEGSCLRVLGLSNGVLRVLIDHEVNVGVPDDCEAQKLPVSATGQNQWILRRNRNAVQ